VGISPEAEFQTPYCRSREISELSKKEVGQRTIASLSKRAVRFGKIDIVEVDDIFFRQTLLPSDR
jgi:hypothetical protein